MHVVTTFFRVKRLPGSVFLGESSLRFRSERQQEYVDCIRLNCCNPNVAAVHLLVEGADAFSDLSRVVLPQLEPRERRKVVPVMSATASQPTYADLFAHANKLLKGKLSMICNADIHLAQEQFDMEQLQQLLQVPGSASAALTLPPTRALALTRYENEQLDAPLIWDYRGSHDAFVVVPPVPAAFLASVHHAQNHYKAENIVIYELQRQGYRVFNPCLSVRIIHRHRADLRQWLPAFDEERYGRAAPCTLTEAVQRAALAC